MGRGADRKRRLGVRVSVCLPARNEAATIGPIVATVRRELMETAGLVDHLVEIGRRRVAVFYQIDAYGRNGWEGVRLSLARHDLKMAGEATYQRGTVYKETLHRQVDILRKTDADAVISIGSYAACAAFIRDARDAGWDVPIANVSFVGSENLLALLKQAGQDAGKDYTIAAAGNEKYLEGFGEPPGALRALL